MKHTQRMLDSGTKIVGGVNPRKAGEQARFADVAVPVFGTVAEAMAETGADVSVVFVPPASPRPPRSRRSTPGSGCSS